MSWGNRALCYVVTRPVASVTDPLLSPWCRIRWGTPARRVCHRRRGHRRHSPWRWAGWYSTHRKNLPPPEMDLGQSCPNDFVLGDRAAAAAAGIAAAAATHPCASPLSCSYLDYLNPCLLHRQAEQRRRTSHADLPLILLPTP